MTPVEFYDEIFGYYYTPWWQTTWFYVAVGCLLCVLIGTALFFMIKRRQRSVESWEWALAELHKHMPQKCTNKEDFKKFYFGLTSIIKEYLHRRYAWDIQDKTDNELVVWLEKNNYANTIVMTVKKISEGALWIKFANMDVLKSQADADWNAVVAMVEQTKEIDTQ